MPQLIRLGTNGEGNAVRRSGVMLWNYRVGVQIYPTDIRSWRVFTYCDDPFTRGIYFMLGRFALAIWWRGVRHA